MSPPGRPKGEFSPAARSAKGWATIAAGETAGRAEARSAWRRAIAQRPARCGCVWRCEYEEADG
jgi:hypothetical protein